MKIVLGKDPKHSRFYDGEGNDITALLNVMTVDLHCTASGLLQVQLTVNPSELIVETEDGNIKLKKSPMYNELKK